MNSTIQFPVKPHLLKYLTFKFGPDFVYTKISPLAPIIRSVLSKECVNYYKPFPTGDYFPVQITELYLNKYGVFFDYRKLYQFNNEVDNLFREELFQFMNFNKDIYGIKYRTSLRDFLAKMNIHEEDIKIETLLRNFTRKHDESKQLKNDKNIEKNEVLKSAS